MIIINIEYLTQKLCVSLIPRLDCIMLDLANILRGSINFQID